MLFGANGCKLAAGRVPTDDVPPVLNGGVPPTPIGCEFVPGNGGFVPGVFANPVCVDLFTTGNCCCCCAPAVVNPGDFWFTLAYGFELLGPPDTTRLSF